MDSSTWPPRKPTPPSTAVFIHVHFVSSVVGTGYPFLICTRKFAGNNNPLPSERGIPFPYSRAYLPYICREMRLYLTCDHLFCISRCLLRAAVQRSENRPVLSA